MSTCKQCQSEVRWVHDASGKLRCQNPDGSDHWDRCSELKMLHFKKHGRAAAWIDDGGQDTEGLIVSQAHALHNKSGNMKTMQALHRESVTITGKNYKPDGCTCGLPPWELCQPDCKHAIKHRGASS